MEKNGNFSRSIHPQEIRVHNVKTGPGTCSASILWCLGIVQLLLHVIEKRCHQGWSNFLALHQQANHQFQCACPKTTDTWLSEGENWGLRCCESLEFGLVTQNRAGYQLLQEGAIRPLKLGSYKTVSSQMGPGNNKLVPTPNTTSLWTAGSWTAGYSSTHYEENIASQCQ